MLDVQLEENILSKGSNMVAWVRNYVKVLAAGLLKSVWSVHMAAACGTLKLITSLCGKTQQRGELISYTNSISVLSIYLTAFFKVISLL